MESERNTEFRRIKTNFPEQSLDLPEEIMEEILSRLPVKSLFKFRCVSKRWPSLFDSKRFIKKHLDNSTHYNIITNTSRPQPGLKQCSLTSMLADPFTDQFTSCDLENASMDWIEIVGCCNGVFCLLLDWKQFMLWNPSTRKTKKLPAFDRNDEHWHITNCGFGFDDLSGDYIVLGIINALRRDRSYERICKVYSLLSNSWKIVEVENVPPFHYGGEFASGKIHWRETGFFITYFDLRSEVFDFIEAPIITGLICRCGGRYCRFMGVFGGRLGLLCNDGVGKLDIWVIKEYGVNSSWDKVFTLPYLHTTLGLGPSYFSLLGIGPNGEILLTSVSGFVIFHPESNGFRHCQVRDLQLGPFGKSVLYIESLVPL